MGGGGVFEASVFQKNCWPWPGNIFFGISTTEKGGVLGGEQAQPQAPKTFF